MFSRSRCRGSLGLAPEWGAAGLTASAGVAGWVEMLLLRSTLNARIGRTGLPASYVAQLWGAALASAAVGVGREGWRLPPLHPVVAAIVVLGPYGVVFFGRARIALANSRGLAPRCATLHKALTGLCCS